MNGVMGRAWKYYRRNGPRRSITMLRRKLAGTASISQASYLNEFTGIAQAFDASNETPRRTGVGGEVPFGGVAIIGDLNLPQCKKYRVLQKIEALGEMGIACEYSSWSDIPRSLNIMQLARTVIFYRMKDNLQFRHYAAEARRLGIPAGYDIDDPIFDEATYGENSNLGFLNAGERRSLLSSTEDYRRAMESCDFVTTSTPALQTLAGRHSKTVYLWRNAVDAETRHWAEFARRAPAAAPSASVILGYASGSRAHEADFRIIENALAEIFKRFDSVRLLVLGYLNLPKSLLQYSNRITAVPFAGFGDYLASMAHVDINLVPLIANHFNACKSAIRHLDAAVVGVPTVASSVGDFANVIAPNRTGVLVDGEAEWIERLTWLIENPGERRRIGAAARQAALTDSSTAATAKDLAPALRAILRVPGA